jgi:predicted ATPase
MVLGTVRTDPCVALDLARTAVQRGSGVLVELRRLSAEEVRRLAGSCLGSDASDVLDQVADHLWAGSEGIPLLAEELLNGMLSSGQLTLEGGVWRIAGPLRRRVSVTLTRTMAGRLDRIGAQGRELLSAAAMLGRRFPLAVLQASSPARRA